MDAMEEARKKRRQQAIRVGLTELLMVLAVGCLTTFLTMLALGYNIGSGLSFERSGLVQINSKPTGATITMDDEDILYRTNTSRTATSGVHVVTLSKDGYGSWTKEINVTEGYYYRLAYPRLFLKKTSTKKIGKVSAPYLMSKAGDSNSLLLIDGKTTRWKMLKFDGEKITTDEFSVQGLFSGAEELEMLADVSVARWSSDGSSAIVKTTYAGATEWIWININDPLTNVNLTRAFSGVFTDIQFKGGASGTLLSLSNGELREINVSAGTISKTIVSGVERLDNNGEKMALVIKDATTGKRYVGVYSEGDKGVAKLYDVVSSGNVFAVIEKYFEDDYMVVLDGDTMLMYQNNLPVYGAKTTKKIEPIISSKLQFAPKSLEKRGDGELVVARDGAKMAVMDAEMFGVVEYDSIDADARWIDDFMLYSVKDGSATVFDFDGLNVRSVINEGVKDGSLVLMSSNGKWMYYLNEKNEIIAVKVG